MKSAEAVSRRFWALSRYFGLASTCSSRGPWPSSESSWPKASNAFCKWVTLADAEADTSSGVGARVLGLGHDPAGARACATEYPSRFDLFHLWLHAFASPHRCLLLVWICPFPMPHQLILHKFIDQCAAPTAFNTACLFYFFQPRRRSWWN